MKHSFFIHQASLDDYPILKNILQNTPNDWTPAILADCFSESYFVWLIVFQEETAGFVVVKNNIDYWEILQLIINQCYQRQGLASSLLKFVVEKALENQIQKLALEVRASNQPAIALYEKIGFLRVGVRKKYYKNGEDAVLMDWCSFTNM